MTAARRSAPASEVTTTRPPEPSVAPSQARSTAVTAAGSAAASAAVSSTPSAIRTAPRAATAGRHTAWTDTDTPLGRLLVARNADGLSGLWFEGQKYHPGELAVPRDDDDPLLRDTVAVLRDYFAGRGSAGSARQDTPPLPPLSPRGTAFQQAVWQALLAIPAGETVTYGELAARLGRPAAVRAVAAAVGRNPVSVLIPCHRVIGADGSLTGYAGGLHRKEALLTLEGRSPVTLRALAQTNKRGDTA